MSLWTPDGEHPVPDDLSFEDLTDDERERAEAMAAELAEARRRVAEVPAAIVVANHAMGLYELGAIHLTRQPPDLDEARVAIDALAALLTGLAGRLGDEEAVLGEALSQLRLAFVSLADSSGEPA